MRQAVFAVLGLAWSLLSAVTPTVAAQSLFIDGGPFVGIERRNSGAVVNDGVRVDGFNPNGIAAGGSLAVGTWLAPRLTARVEVGWPTTLERSATLSGTFALVNNQTRLLYSSTQTTWDQARTLSVLLGYHTARHRGWQLGYLAGAVYVSQRLQQRLETRYPEFTPGGFNPNGPVALVNPPREIVDVAEGKRTDYAVGLAVGIDADMALGRRFSVVPQVRAIGLRSGLSIRPGVGLRVTF